MRELTSLKDQQQADRLVAYLAVQAIESMCDHDNNEWVVWIQNDDDRQKAAQILGDFEQNPEDPKYENAERKVRHVLQEADRLRQESSKRLGRSRKQWGGPWWACYPATYIMIGLCVVVAVVCTDLRNMEDGGLGPRLCNNNQSFLRNQLDVVSPVRIVKDQNGQVARYFQISPPFAEGLFALNKFQWGSMQEMQNSLNLFGNDLLAFGRGLQDKLIYTWESLKTTMASGEVWRPVGPIFLHMSLLHIFFNMMWLRSMGCIIEFVRGTPRFLTLCLILAITSNIGQLFWSGPFFGGMSGVVFGLIGYVWMKGKTQPQLGIGLPQQTLVFCILWLVLCMVGVFGNIANAAHLVGFVVGILIGARQAIWKKLSFSQT